MISSGTRVLLSWIFATFICAFLLIPALSFSEELKVNRLFRIERSMNANIVCYDARLTPEGKLDPEKPIIAYWIMHANNNEKEDLKWIEKKLGFGFKVKYDIEYDLWVMDLVADIQRKVKVYKVNGKYLAETLIDSQPAFVEKLYIKFIEGGIHPKVEYMEFFGKCIKTGENLYEKFIPV